MNPFTPRVKRKSINVAVPFASVDETRVCYHSNESYIYIEQYFHIMRYCLFLTILQNDLQDFFLRFELSTLGSESRVKVVRLKVIKVK